MYLDVRPLVVCWHTTLVLVTGPRLPTMWKETSILEPELMKMMLMLLSAMICLPDIIILTFDDSLPACELTDCGLTWNALFYPWTTWLNSTYGTDFWLWCTPCCCCMVPGIDFLWWGGCSHMICLVLWWFLYSDQLACFRASLGSTSLEVSGCSSSVQVPVTLLRILVSTLWFGPGWPWWPSLHWCFVGWLWLWDGPVRSWQWAQSAISWSKSLWRCYCLLLLCHLALLWSIHRFSGPSLATSRCWTLNWLWVPLLNL